MLAGRGMSSLGEEAR
ncbi:hypothetical protein A2U01_0116718, partial [Trifolium medium]|nr:hypothetical protein [Trifolium medium]